MNEQAQAPQPPAAETAGMRRIAAMNDAHLKFHGHLGKLVEAAALRGGLSLLEITAVLEFQAQIVRQTAADAMLRQKMEEQQVAVPTPQEVAALKRRPHARGGEPH